MMIMLCRISLVVLSILFCIGGSIFAEQTASEDSGKLISEVLSAMEANQATLDSVMTMQSVLTKNSTHSFADKKGYQLVEKHRIIYDGDHFRKDQLETKFSGEKEYKRYAGAVTVGRVDIDTAESNTDYIPSNNMVFVRPPRWSNGYKIITNDLLKYQSARGATLKKNIMASAKNGYYFTATSDRVDEDDCILLTCDYPNTGSTLKIWVVPLKGYCIKKVQDSSMGEINDEYTTILKEYSPGMWWFDSVQAKRTSGKETVVCRLLVDSLTFNEPIGPEIFTAWGIGISSKTKIWDEMQGKMYTLAIDDAKNEAVNLTGSSRKILIVGLGVLMLIAIASISIFIKVKKVRGEQQS